MKWTPSDGKFICDQLNANNTEKQAGKTTLNNM